MSEAVAAVISLAEAQRKRLESGDVDAYIAGLGEYGAACQVLGSGLEEKDRPEFERLLQIDAQMADLLRAAKESAAKKLAGLGRGRLANGAYLAATAPARNALFEG